MTRPLACILTMCVLNLLAAEPYLPNGTLENGLQEWTVWGAEASGDAYEDSGCAVVKNDSPKWSGMHQYVRAPHGADSLVVSGWMKTVDVVRGSNVWENARISLEFHDSCHVVVSHPGAPAEADGATEWTRYSWTFALDDNVCYVKVLCALGNATGTAWFDSIAVGFVARGTGRIAHDSATYPSVHEEYEDPAPGRQVYCRTDSGTRYLLYLPEGYDGRKRWPLVIFLHGAGERGSCLSRLERHGPPPHAVAEGAAFPFILLSPLCPVDGWWYDSLVEPAYQEVMKHYAVDRTRISVTGLSMGGFGTMELAAAHPRRYAAILPVAGGYGRLGGNGRGPKVPENICELKGMAIRIVHGASDEMAPPERSKVVVEALKKCGIEPMLTLYPDTKHVASFKKAYAEPGIYDWLVSQRRTR